MLFFFSVILYPVCMRIMLASANNHKLEEFRMIFPGHELVLAPSFDCEETGETFIENALIKANALRALYPDQVILADDSGLIVDALPGELGVRTARFGSQEAGRLLDAGERNCLLLKKLAGIPWEKRTGRFVCVLALIWGNGRTAVVQETVEGHIVEKETGIHGFGYDPVFMINGQDRTTAELGEQVKCAISHRGRAARRMSLIIKQIEGEEYEQ